MKDDDKDCKGNDNVKTPTQKISLLQQLFSQRIVANKGTLPSTIECKEGTPLYKISDICRTINPVAKILRMIFVDRNVTYEELFSKHKRKCELEGMIPRQLNTNKGNIKKVLVKNRMSMKQFEKLLLILDLKIENVSFTIKDSKTGTLKTYSLSDTAKYSNKSNENIVFNGIFLDDEDDEDL